MAGSLLSLSLARRGVRVVLVGRDGPSATSLSYAGVRAPGIRAWQELEQRHGPLGFRSSRLVMHGWPGPLQQLPPALQALPTALLPMGRLDAPTLAAALPRALERMGVVRHDRAVSAIERSADGGWALIDATGQPIRLADTRNGAGRHLAPAAVVLAAGAGCRGLWPDLAERLRFSWAGVIEIDPEALGAEDREHGWLAQVLKGRLIQPLRLRRLRLEAEAATLKEARWIVDAGLAPWGSRVLLGQITLVEPDPDPNRPPDPARMETRLRSGLAELDPRLAALPGTYRQAPVSYCLEGDALAAPVAHAPGLWVFAGFSGAFTVVPSLADRLADHLVEHLGRSVAAAQAGVHPSSGAAP